MGGLRNNKNAWLCLKVISATYSIFTSSFESADHFGENSADFLSVYCCSRVLFEVEKKI